MSVTTWALLVVYLILRLVSMITGIPMTDSDCGYD